MIESRGHAENPGAEHYERASILIGQINPVLLSLPQYSRALQINSGQGLREVPFDLDYEDGTIVRYEVAVDFNNGQERPPSKLFIAKYALVPRGPALQKNPIAKLQLIAEEGPEGKLSRKYGYAAIIVGRTATPIERDGQMPLVHQHFAEFLS